MGLHLSQEGRSGQQPTAQCHSAASLPASTEKNGFAAVHVPLFSYFTVDFSSLIAPLAVLSLLSGELLFLL